MRTGAALSHMRCKTGEIRDFIAANTSLCAPPHVPEIELYLASEAMIFG